MLGNKTFFKNSFLKFEVTKLEDGRKQAIRIVLFFIGEEISDHKLAILSSFVYLKSL